MAKTKTIPRAAERWALPAQQARSRAMRARLLAAAEEVFAAKGYEGTRIADIAEAAKCSVGAVYFRFKDKDALFFAIAESFADDVRARMSDLTQANDPRRTVREFVTRTAAQFRAHRGMFRAVVERGFDHAPAMATIMNLREEMARALEATLLAHVKGKSADDIAVAVRVLTQMVYGFLLAGALNAKAPTNIDDPHAVSEAADAMAAYLESKGLLQ
jgi:AcrR family transcriptional regulator